ncbi:MAG: hypothetical protein M9927_04405 [Anaerolineae bacterium]|nr:hypothetical protein [Anaerolineae bacterium]
MLALARVLVEQGRCLLRWMWLTTDWALASRGADGVACWTVQQAQKVGENALALAQVAFLGAFLWKTTLRSKPLPEMSGCGDQIRSVAADGAVKLAQQDRCLPARADAGGAAMAVIDRSFSSFYLELGDRGGAPHTGLGHRQMQAAG